MKRRAAKSAGHRFSEEARRKGGAASGAKLHEITIREIEQILTKGAPWSVAKTRKTAIKKYIINLQGNKCAECGCEGIWRGELLSMDLDHIDGNPDNNLLTNFRILCPNCHRITEYWGNSKAKRKSANPGRYVLEKT
jgi:hypothetical protein